VDSSVLLFNLEDKYPEVDDEIFLNFIKKAFLAPRKKLVKNLTNS
jgi:16S rRNA A1518/A1519 N6-dimethyltransferase RsmA/KsgA/DIM1 with predicted DNA glycosylase/AP lyase activity